MNLLKYERNNVNTMTFPRVFAALSIGLVSVLHGAEIHVAPGGSDLNSGAPGKALATLAAAQRVARQFAGKEAVTVVLEDGIYYLPEPLRFGPEDSGTAATPQIWAAAPGAKPVISGGVLLGLDWQPLKNGIFQAKVPPGLETDQIFVNGERQILARYPNFNPQERIFNGYAADAISPERARTWSDPAGGFLHAMHPAQWGGFSYVITGRNADGKVTYEGGWQGNRASQPHEKYRMVEGILEELDAPGEWFLNRKTDTLYFYPPQGLDLKTAKVEAVRLRHLIEFRGTEERPVRFITLRGLTFRHTARTFMLTREPILRSDWTIYRGGAVLFDGAEDCSLEESFLDQVGGNAVFVNNFNRRVTVRGCRIENAGAGGVTFVGDPKAVRSPLFEYGQKQKFKDTDLTPGPKSANYPADCLVDDCLITRIGRVEKQSAGIGIDMAARITVRHCSIYDVPRAGINIGDGCWGGHVIEYCDIFDTVKETGDHGSFNSWGRDRYWNLQGWDPATHPEVALLDVVEPITLRDSRWRCDHGWAIDLDDGSSNYRIYNNLLLNGGLKLREGFHRRVWNNIAVNNSLHPHVWYEDSRDEVTRNIWMGPYRPAGAMPKGKWGMEVDRNLFTTSGADRSRFADHNCDANSLAGDPMYVDPASGDFRVRDGSPALKLGFLNFPMDQFGVVSPALKARARVPEMPALKPGAAISRTIKTQWQGAIVKELEGEEYSAYGTAKEDGGIALLEVPAGSSPDRAGLRVGDVVQAVNDKPVRTFKDMAAALGAGNKGVTITFMRRQARMQAEFRPAQLVEEIKVPIADGPCEPTRKSLGLARTEDAPLFENHTRILFQGDSITDGNRGRSADPNHILGHGYVFIIAARNGAASPQCDWTFINRGVSGNRVPDLIKRWPTDALDLKPDVLSILIGVNDLNSLSADEYEVQYDKLLADTVAALPGVKLVLCEPFGLPNPKKPENWPTRRNDLARRQAIVKKLATKYHAVFVPLQEVFDDACRRAPAEYWIWDGVHPTYAGHQLLADRWERVVREQRWGVIKK